MNTEYYHTVPITLDMKERIESIRYQYGHNSSSHAFASLYIWKQDMGLSIFLTDSFFAVRCLWRGTNAWLFPCGEPEAIRRFLKDAMGEPDFLLCYLREEDVKFLEREFPGQFRIEETPDDHEYLYDCAEQKTLVGRKFSGIRNHIRRAQNDYALTCEPLAEENIADAIAVNHAWARQEHSPHDLADCFASELLLQKWKELDVRGILVRLDGEPFSVAAGYPLAPDVFDLCLARQKQLLGGIGIYTKHALIASLPDHFRFFNAEEDMGIEGLRKMKKQMRPCGMLTTFEGRTLSDGKTVE
ncbi:MAG: phosphatidylglycerol lysyltransferase domain-containing protein [Clostridiales bacterium]|nr:phosphatidylglycerol lysyltransferase domain-containing protein [Clostridiales bacterium]